MREKKEEEQPEVLGTNETADGEFEDSKAEDDSNNCDPLTTRQVGRLPARAFRR